MIVKSWFGRGWEWKIGGWVSLVAALSIGLSENVLAQIVPDNTLGVESSVVKPNVNIQGIVSDRIDGGAIRGANLFHSFREFNIGEGRGAYFANPTGIENILSRVTGNSRSEIFGRLGVLGSANLFFMNPNGIIFGQNASLDVEGSFFATTADAIALGKQGYFSATQPQQSSLLSVSPGALFFNQAAAQPGNIINQGNLSAPKDLTLAGSNLDLQGQFYAGGNLTLQATDTVKIRDNEASPFLARSGGNLAIVGNQGIDILALNYPTQTPFVSGGNLSLVSDGIISGDARFNSSGSFSIHNLSGGLANFVSKYDPIISSNGDVDVTANYTGSSLLVESKGNIRFQGDINITTPDTSPLPAGQDTATLSNSTALIMRSGQNTLAYRGVNSGSLFALKSGTVPEGITLGGNITLQPFNGVGGIVNLLAASGNVSTQEMTTNGGTIEISSGRAIVTNGKTLDTTNGGNNGGAITLTAQNNITTGKLYSDSLGAGNGGNITLRSTGGGIDTSAGTLDSISSTGNGGAITLTAQNNITTGSYLGSFSLSGNGGKITLLSTSGGIDTSAGTLNSVSSTGNGEAIALTAQNDIKTGNLYSSSNGTGKGGKITLLSTSGGIDTSAGTLNSASNTGNGRAIALTAQNDIKTGNLYSYSNGAGKGGNITLSSTGGSINSSTGDLFSYSKTGNGGAIALTAQNNIKTGNLSSFSSGNAGSGGAIHLSATGGSIKTGYLSSGSLSSGKAGAGGAIHLSATGGSIKTGYLSSGSSSLGNAGSGGAIHLSAIGGGIFTSNLISNSFSSSGKAGAGGAIHLSTTGGSIKTGFLSSGSFSSSGKAGAGGAIHLSAIGGSIKTGYLSSSSSSSSGNAGSGGAIHLSAIGGNINTNFLYSFSLSSGNAGAGGAIHLSATDGSISTSNLISNSFSSSGNAGEGANISLEATNTIRFLQYKFDPNTSTYKLVPGTGSINSTGKLGSGNITITSHAPFAYDNGIITSDTFGRGKGGDILISAPAITLSGGAQLSASTHSSGAGGNITMRASDKVELSGATTQAPQNIFSGPIGGFLAIPPSTYLGGYIPNGDVDKYPQDNNGNRIPPLGTQFPSGMFTQTTVDSGGSAGNIKIETGQLSIKDGAAVATTTFGHNSNAGNISVQADSISVANGSILSGVAGGAIGNSGDIDLSTRSLSITTGGTVQTQTLGEGIAGNIQVNATDAVTISGINPTSHTPSGLRSGSGGSNTLLGTANNNIGQGGDIYVTTDNLSVADGGVLDAQTLTNSRGGDITINANTLSAVNGGQLLTSTSSGGQAGSLSIDASQAVTISGNSQLSVETSGAGAGGKLDIETQRLTIQDGAQVSASTSSPNPNGVGGNITVKATQSLDINQASLLAKSNGAAPAGKIKINTGNLTARDGTIATSSKESSGGAINITASDIRLFGNSDIRTDVASGAGGGGNINLAANSIIAFGDSDILAYADRNDGGKGGNIIFDTKAFFGENYSPASSGNNPPNTLDGNNRVDINATGAVSGVITLPDTTFIPNSLTELPENQINTESILANSCIVRRNQPTRGT
ncbi:MAG: filamentous hemagglutinin N-terminal domain-containing protein, partial [Nostoc sp.]|uniref:beta strand repeat-containing protein n=1 Tax=Nostoc sp. TaxID=1180 RepID=UPI002FF52A1F